MSKKKEKLMSKPSPKQVAKPFQQTSVTYTRKQLAAIAERDLHLTKAELATVLKVLKHHIHRAEVWRADALKAEKYEHVVNADRSLEQLRWLWKYSSEGYRARESYKRVKVVD